MEARRLQEFYAHCEVSYHLLPFAMSGCLCVLT